MTEISNLGVSNMSKTSVLQNLPHVVIVGAGFGGLQAARSYVVGYRSRVFVFFKWAWEYLTYDRAVRLITRQ